MNWRILAAFLAGLALISGGVPARADKAVRPDTLQTLGVGARSIGMGGAFVAIADDSTSIFWNPAGLAGVKAELAVDLRTLPKASTRLSKPSRDVSAGNPEFAFAGAAYPAGRGGAIGVARTLGGYEEVHFTGSPGGTEIARYWFNSVGYGKIVSKKLRVGAALHVAELNALDSINGKGTQQDSGLGVTFGAGALYYPMGEGGPITLGLAYLHPTSVGTLNLPPTFGERIGGRVSAGAAYRRGPVLVSGEVRHYFGSESNPNTTLEARSSVTDYHGGVQYQFGPDYGAFLVRAGFYTRNSSNGSLFYDDRVATVGIGYRARNTYLIDVSVEKSLVHGDPLVTSSFRYRFR